MHEEEDDPLRLGLEVRRSHDERIGGVEFDVGRHRGVALEQAREGQHSESARGVTQHAAPRHGLHRVHVFDHLLVIHRWALRSRIKLVRHAGINPRR